jgi:hypothetical protein
VGVFKYTVANLRLLVEHIRFDTMTATHRRLTARVLVLAVLVCVTLIESSQARHRGHRGSLGGSGRGIKCSLEKNQALGECALAVMDENGDGMVSRAEVDHAMARYEVPRFVMTTKKFMDWCDTNGDGMLTVAEALAAPSCDAPSIARCALRKRGAAYIGCSQ